jgi:glutathione S-transferase
MSMKLYFHPLASFCHKALIAFYENGIPFEPVIVDLSDAASSAAFRASSMPPSWPVSAPPSPGTPEARRREPGSCS